MHGNIRLIGWHNFFTDFRLFAPFMVIYFADVSGSFTLGMSVISIQMLAAAFLEIPTGILSDRIGRKSTLALGSAFSVLAISAYAAAPSFGELAFAILAVGGLLDGVSRSLFTGNNTALIYDSARETGDEARYHHLLGRTSTLFQVALAISAILGGLLLTVYSIRLLVILSIVPQILALLVSLRVTEPRVHKAISENALAHFKAAFHHLRSHHRLRWLTLAESLVFGFGEANHQFITAYFKTLWPLWAIGVLRSATHVLSGLSFWLSGRLIDRFGHLPILMFNRCYSFILNVIALVSNSFISPLLISSIAMFHGVTTVASDHLTQQTFTDDQRATLGSLVSFIGSLVFALAALMIGTVADAYGLRVAVAITVTVSVGVTPIYLYLFRGEQQKP